jgi:hypothetical protein
MKISQMGQWSSLVLILAIGILLAGCQAQEFNKLSVERSEHSEYLEDDTESEPSLIETMAACARATASQTSVVNTGAAKLAKFLNRCYAETNSKRWCDEVARPNPESSSAFDCTYSIQQTHVFVHPDESTWKYAIGAVKLVQELVAQGVKVSTIYNWWRPEPYNKNVGGAAGRHPLGTSVDVRFASKTEQNKAHSSLCKMRAAGRMRALGYYSGTGLHLGMGDRAANTWGKSCS